MLTHAAKSVKKRLANPKSYRIYCGLSRIYAEAYTCKR